MPRGAGAVDAAGAGTGLGPGSRTLGTRSSWCSRPTTGSIKVCLPLARRPHAPCEPCWPTRPLDRAPTDPRARGAGASARPPPDRRARLCGRARLARQRARLPARLLARAPPPRIRSCDHRPSRGRRRRVGRGRRRSLARARPLPSESDGEKRVRGPRGVFVVTQWCCVCGPLCFGSCALWRRVAGLPFQPLRQR